MTHDQRLAAVSEALAAEGLEQYTSLVTPHVRAGVRLMLDAPVTAEAPAPVGASRVGGDPDLPVDVAWPTTAAGELLDFAYQVDLTSLPDDVRAELPPGRLLSLFVGPQEPAADVPHALVVAPLDAPLERRVQPEGTRAGDVARTEDGEPVAEWTLRPVVVPDIPQWSNRECDALEDQMEPDDADDYMELAYTFDPEGEQVGSLLGHACGIGSDPREDAFVVREVDPSFLYNSAERSKLDMARAEQWRHVATLESSQTLDTCIWDAGWLNVMARHDVMTTDLAGSYASIESS